jgi:hypothetical protein
MDFPNFTENKAWLRLVSATGWPVAPRLSPLRKRLRFRSYDGSLENGEPMSEWRDEINRKALARLTLALPAVFPRPALIHALARRFTPPMPRLAIDSYWRAHPVRGDRLARALARRSGAPPGWTWRLADEKQAPVKRRSRKPDGEADWLSASFRIPPAPYREGRFARGTGFCCICGQPVYRFGWHVDLWDRGANRNAAWHAACVVAWDFWTAPSDYARVLKRLQQRRCAETGGRLWKTAEVDHRVPLFRVWREHRHTPWPSLLGFWGVPNLQVINREAHVEKCADEAQFRRVIAEGV